MTKELIKQFVMPNLTLEDKIGIYNDLQEWRANDGDFIGDLNELTAPQNYEGEGVIFKRLYGEVTYDRCRKQARYWLYGANYYANDEDQNSANYGNKIRPVTDATIDAICNGVLDDIADIYDDEATHGTFRDIYHLAECFHSRINFTAMWIIDNADELISQSKTLNAACKITQIVLLDRAKKTMFTIKNVADKYASYYESKEMTLVIFVNKTNTIEIYDGATYMQYAIYSHMKVENLANINNYAHQSITLPTSEENVLYEEEIPESFVRVMVYLESNKSVNFFDVPNSVFLGEGDCESAVEDYIRSQFASHITESLNIKVVSKVFYSSTDENDPVMEVCLDDTIV